MDFGPSTSNLWLFAVYATLLVLGLGLFLWRHLAPSLSEKTKVIRKARDPLHEGEQGHVDQLPDNLAKPLRQAYKKFMRHKQYKAAAGILESAGLVNEAAYLLAQHQHVDDAVATMLRLNNHVGAGAIYARAERWQDAAMHYTRGKAYGDAAQCYLRIHEVEAAATNFEMAGMIDDAVRCYLQVKKFDLAIRLQLKAKDYQGARHTMLFYAYKSEDAFVAREFTREEFFIIRQEILNGHLVVGFIRAYEKHFGLGEIILSFMKNETLDKATVLYQSFKGEALDRYLYDNVCYWDGSGLYLGEFFTRNGNHAAAAIAFERSQNFTKASLAYEAAGDLKRAIETSLEAQEWDRAETLRQAQAKSPTATPSTTMAEAHQDAKPTSILMSGDSKGPPAPIPTNNAAFFQLGDSGASFVSDKVMIPPLRGPAASDFVIDDSGQEAMIEIKSLKD